MNKGLIKLSGLDYFNATVLKVLDNEARIIMKFFRANEAPIMNRAIENAIMKRSRLGKKFLKNPEIENNMIY